MVHAATPRPPTWRSRCRCLPPFPAWTARWRWSKAFLPEFEIAVAGGGAFLRWVEHLDGTAAADLTTEGGLPGLVRVGTLSYLAGWPDTVAWDRIVSAACARAELDTTTLPQGLRLRETPTHRFAFNYAAYPVEWNGQILPPAGVAWWPV